MKRVFLNCYTSFQCRNFLTILLGFFICSLFFARYHNNGKYSEYLLKSLQGPMKYDDPELIHYIKNHVLEPPSLADYKLNTHHLEYLASRNFNGPDFYENLTKMFFGDQYQGFFIEAGALDGQALSNTLWLEMNRNWTGFLVEPDPSNYHLLKTRNRKAWTARSCLALDVFPKVEKLTSQDVTLNTKLFNDIRHRAMGSIVRDDGKQVGWTQDEFGNSVYKRQCFPLNSFLLALNVSKIDLFSLDVEFVEEEILRSFDFERFHVEVIYIEWWIYDKFKWLLNFMDEKGFMFVSNKEGDVVFAKKNSRAARIVTEKMPNRVVNYFVADKKLNRQYKVKSFSEIYGKANI